MNESEWLDWANLQRAKQILEEENEKLRQEIIKLKRSITFWKRGGFKKKVVSESVKEKPATGSPP